MRITATDTSLTGGAPAIMAYGTPKGDNWVGVGASTSAPTYSVGGTISGLSGTAVLENNGGNDLSTSANGAFTFSTLLARAPPTTSPSRPTLRADLHRHEPVGHGGRGQRHQRLGHLRHPGRPHVLGRGHHLGALGNRGPREQRRQRSQHQRQRHVHLQHPVGPGRRLQRHRQDQPFGADLLRHEPVGHGGRGQRHQRLGHLRHPDGAAPSRTTSTGRTELWAPTGPT